MLLNNLLDSIFRILGKTMQEYAIDSIPGQRLEHMDKNVSGMVKGKLGTVIVHAHNNIILREGSVEVFSKYYNNVKELEGQKRTYCSFGYFVL